MRSAGLLRFVRFRRCLRRRRLRFVLFRQGPDGTDASLVGTWANDSANERTVQTFTADRVHQGDYLNKCLIQETWGRYTYADGLLRIVFDSLHSRMYFTMEHDSASTCADPMQRQSVEGSMSLRLENVTASNFTAVTRTVTVENGKSTIGERRRVFTKQ